jgi:hypothetical protein
MSDKNVKKVEKKKGGQSKTKRKKMSKLYSSAICLSGTCGVFFIEALSAVPNST